MKIRAQVAMVLNLDKCIGCHTCSVTCKNVWTNREGMEYAWFNNVETKPGIGYPKDWENQDRWNGGWRRKKNGKIEPRIGSKWRVLANIFSNPDLPEIDDYYEPFTFDYEHLQTAPELQASPTARPRSLITGERMEDQFGGAKPGRGHRAIASLYRAGKVPGLITQNIDNLHQASGVAANDVVELHGNTTYATCLDCGERFELPWVRKKFETAGNRAPDCDCGGYIKTATVSFGQAMPAEAMPRTADAITGKKHF